jgi:hypothetical protein
MTPKPRHRPARVDWFRVIVNLERQGYSIRDLAFLVERGKGWIEHLKNSPGAEPRYDDGSVLLDLWCEAMDKPLTDVPREGYSIGTAPVICPGT